MPKEDAVSRIECGHNAWKKGQGAIGALKVQPIAASGGWTSEETFTAKICVLQNVQIYTVSLKFSGDELRYNRQANVAFGPTKQRELIGTP